MLFKLPIELMQRRLILKMPLKNADHLRVRACLHGGGGPQVGGKPRWGNPPVHIISYIILITFT